MGANGNAVQVATAKVSKKRGIESPIGLELFSDGASVVILSASDYNRLAAIYNRHVHNGAFGPGNSLQEWQQERGRSEVGRWG